LNVNETSQAIEKAISLAQESEDPCPELMETPGQGGFEIIG